MKPSSKFVFVALIFIGASKLVDLIMNWNILGNMAFGIVAIAGVYLMRKKLGSQGLFNWKRIALLFLMVILMFAALIFFLEALPNNDFGLWTGEILSFSLVGGMVWWIFRLSKKIENQNSNQS